MHSLGFIHEQSRKDRDQYVGVQWDNIEERAYNQFAIVPEGWQSSQEDPIFEFSYNTIMIYEENFFAIDKSKPTLVSLTENKIQPSRDGLNEVDRERINKIY